MTPQQSGQQQQQLMVDTTCGSLLRELQVCFWFAVATFVGAACLLVVFKRIGYFHTRDYLRAQERKNRRDVPKSCKKGSDN
jgi:hypothetical protein